MDRHLMERLEEFLKNEGFERFEVYRASTSLTLSATKEETDLVIYMAEGVSLPHHAQAVPNTPVHLIAVRPTPIGSVAIAGSETVDGGGGAVRAGERSRTRKDLQA